MPTPVARSPLNVYEGISPDDLNQLLGTHAPVVIYDNITALIGAALPAAANPPEFQYFQQLVSPTGSPISVDQPITMTGTILDRVELPVSVLSGVGQDVLVGLYADSGGVPTGLPLAQTYVPRELIPAAGTNLPGHGVLMSETWTLQASMVPPAPYDTYTSPGFASDGTVAIFVGGQNASFVTTTGTIIGLMAPATGTVTQWNPGPAYPVSVYEAAVAVDAQSYVYVSGGAASGGAPVGNVYSALYSSQPPTIGAWQPQLALPQTLVNNTMIVISSGTASGATPILYSVGGNHSGTGGTKVVYAAPITSPGLIGAWTTPANSQLPFSNLLGTLVQINGYLVLMGGETDNSLPTYTVGVWAAPIHNDNTIGSWVPWPSLPAAGNGTASVYGNTIIFVNQQQAWSLDVSATGQPDPLWQNCSQQFTSIVGSPQATFLSCVTGNYLMNFTKNADVTQITPASTPLQFVTMMSVPLRVTGLTSTHVYHIIVSPMGNCDQFNVTQVAMASTQPTTAYAAGLGETGPASGFTTGQNILPAYMGSAVSSGWDAASGRYDVNCTVTYAGAVITMTAIQAANMAMSTLNTLTPNNLGTEGAPDITGQFSIPVIGGVSYTFTATYKCAVTAQTIDAVLQFSDASGNNLATAGVGTASDSVGGVVISATVTAPLNAAFAALAVNVLQLVTLPAAGEVHTVSNISLNQNFGYVPLSLFVSGKNLKPVHVLDDIANTQPYGWNWITYDYSGKPLQIAECILPRVNLIAPNDSNLGGPVKGTAANWSVGANCALTVAAPSVQPLGTPVPATPSAPMFPAINVQQCAYALVMTSSGAGDMSALSPFGTSGVPVTVGQHYTAFAYFNSAVHARSCSVTINWYTAAGSACAHPSDAGVAVVDNTTGWVQAYVNAIAPATAAFAAVVVVAAATGGASEVHNVTCVQFSLDNSLNNGFALPQLAYFEPGSGPGGMRNLVVLGYDSATSQLVSVTPNNPLTYFGTGQTTTYTASGMTDTQAVWPMNGLVGQVISAPADIINASNAAQTTATVLFNIGNTIVLTTAGWSNGQPTDGSAYSIT